MAGEHGIDSAMNGKLSATVHDFLEQSCTVDTVGEFSLSRASSLNSTLWIA